MTLFRREAYEQNVNHHHGDALITVPLPWTAITLFIGVSVLAALAFAASVSYSRVQVVTGVITPEDGLSPISPSRGGVISSIPVREGHMVRKGDLLAEIRVEEDGPQSVSPSALIQDAIARQDASLAVQLEAARAAADAQLRQLEAQRAGLISEIEHIQHQQSLQADLIDTAKRHLDRVREIAGRGFLSQNELQIREETLLSRRQEMARLSQTLSVKKSALAEAERRSRHVREQSRVQEASIAAGRAQIGQEAASMAASRSYVLRAPRAGVVTALTARLGQPAVPGEALMIIVPSDSPLHAELDVPSAAIGFVKPGQEVRLAIDAFPFQRFGTVTGRVKSVPESATSRLGPNGAVVPVYPVLVELGEPAIVAYNRHEPLVSGMTLTARIIAEQQSLLEWLFEPIYAVGRR